MFARRQTSEAEPALLHRAANWPHYPALEDLTDNALQGITRSEGIDFATALLFNRFQQTPRRQEFIRQLDRLRRTGSSGNLEIAANVVIVPGALYVERPDMGGDGHLIRQVAAGFGLQTELIPLASCGSIETNAMIIRQWLQSRSRQSLILISLSKGGADLKLALSAPDAPELFRDVIAWINVCGPLNGSRMANWILKSRLRTWILRTKFGWQKRDFRFVTDLQHGPGTPLDFPLPQLPSLRILSLIGFPLKRHLSTPFSRYCHRVISTFGPNDGTTLLSDLKALPGDIYPAWGMDHYFRPAQDAQSLIIAMLGYLAETTCAAGAETGNRKTSPEA